MSALSGNPFDSIVSLETLTKAHKKCMAGKRSSRNAATSNYAFMSELLEIQAELVSGLYRPAPYRRRLITEPKVRRIQAPAFRDRIVHHAIHSVLNPFYERHFINDSYACRPGKGTHRAVARVQKFVKLNPNAYACQLDISKYYGSVNHDKLYQLLVKRIADQRLLDLLRVIIDSSDSGTEYDHLFAPDSHFHTKGRRGIPIGNLTSQLFANIYLHEADMYAKQKLKIRQYIRYMDDILIFHPCKKQLRQWQDSLTNFLYEELYLTMNPRKIRVYPARTGVDFVGFVSYPRTRRVRSSSVRRFRRRFNKKLKGLAEGRVNIDSTNATFNAWSAHVTHGNGQRLIEQERAKFEPAAFVCAILRQHRKNLRRQEKQRPVQLKLFDDLPD